MGLETRSDAVAPQQKHSPIPWDRRQAFFHWDSADRTGTAARFPGSDTDGRMTGMTIKSMFFSIHARAIVLALAGWAFSPAASLVACGTAQAQSIVATVNGDAITSYDIAEREKLLSVLGLPASPAAALESMIKSRLEAGEINKFGIKISANEFGAAVQYFAERAHVSTEAMGARLQNAHVDKKHLENFLSIHTGFNMYTRARNRAVEVSQSDIDAEIARDKKLANQQTYVIRQVLLAVPPETGAAGLQQAAKQMEALHSRFTSCETGAKLVSEYPNLVVREPLTRTSSQLNEQLTAMLDKLPIGHLSPASRDPSGVVALALCSRSASKSDAAREAAQQRILARKVQQDADKLYEEIRSHAVIVTAKK
jgi:peptidyl-prolyl cis-trans isomerase SurA